MVEAICIIVGFALICELFETDIDNLRNYFKNKRVEKTIKLKESQLCRKLTKEEKDEIWYFGDIILKGKKE